MTTIFPFLQTIKHVPGGGYELSPEGLAFFGPYLARQGFSLVAISTHNELLNILSYCNSLDFSRIVQQPAPTSDLRLLWRGLRNLGRRA